MTSVPLPSLIHGTTAEREKVPRKYSFPDTLASCERRLPRYHAPAHGTTKMNVFHSISSFLRKNKKVAEKTEPVQARRVAETGPGTTSLPDSKCNENLDKKVEEESVELEGSEFSDKDDIAFVRSTFRQSVKRAMGWRKSQRKAVNKRKKENIQNSKLLTGGNKADEEEFYDDNELDVVVVNEVDGDVGTQTEPDNRRSVTPASAKSSKIPKRRNSLKRPAVSIKSSGFFSQSVASKKSDGGKTVTARTNKAAELREVAIKKKLENSPAPGQSTSVPIPAPAARRKPRASFRTKKGISRRPLHKKDIKPAENKASQLRAKKHQEEAAEDETKQKSETKEPEARRSERFSSVAIKTPAPGTENRDPLSYMQNSRHDSASRPRNSTSTSKPESTPVKTPGRATRTVPQKPVRSKIPSGSNTSSTSSSNVPSPSPRLMPTPPSLPLSKSSDDFQTRKYSGRSEKTSSSIPKRRTFSPQVNSPQDPTKDLVFIPLDSVSLPLPSEKKKIDDMKRKRKIQRPVSNIFEGGSGDLPSSNIRRQHSTDDTNFTVHVNKTPAKSVTTTKPRSSSFTKTPISSSVPNSSSNNFTSRLNSTGCIKNRTKSKPVPNTSNFKRQNSVESSRRSKKGISVISRLSESNSLISESTENSCSYDSSRSLDEFIESLPGSPKQCDSPRLPGTDVTMSETPPETDLPIIRTPPVLISIDELEIQKEKLRTPRKRSGSISVKKVKARKSWIRPDAEIIDPDVDKVKCALTDEVLIIEDLISGHSDITQKLSSRTQVLKNITSALRRSNVERAARMTVSLCFPRSHPDEEFKTMRRACQCTSDDLALFQNCLSLLLTDRDKMTLPVVAILISKVRFTFEVLGTEVLRGNIGETLKLIAGNYGAKIAHRDSTPGMNYRLHENAETCSQELLLVKNHVTKLTAIDYSPELLALKKTLELFDL